MKLVPIGAAAGLLAAALPACAAPARLEIIRNRPFVEATIARRPVSALLDSGAEMTLIDDDFAARLGLALSGAETARGSGGSQPARFAEGVDLAAAGVSLPRRTVAVIDLDEISARLIGRKLEMILGRDLFDSARLRIDIAGGMIESVARDRRPNGVRLPLRSDHGLESMPVMIEGAHAPAHFDLGNGSEVMIGKALAVRLGLARAGRIVERRAGGGIGGAIERDIVILQSLRIGGREFRDVPAAIDPTPTAGDVNIGTSILRHFVITTDFPQRSLWLEPRK